MIIFDFNYADLFYDTKHFSNLAPIRKEKIPVIFGYIPKLYREDCYNIYNKNVSEANKVNIQKYIKKICNKSDFEYYKEKSDKSEEEIKDLYRQIQSIKEERKKEIQLLIEEKEKIKKDNEENDKKKNEEIDKIKKEKEEKENELKKTQKEKEEKEKELKKTQKEKEEMKKEKEEMEKQFLEIKKQNEELMKKLNQKKTKKEQENQRNEDN